MAKWGAVALVAFLVLAVGAARAAGPFDGDWKGSGSADGIGCHDNDFTLTVTNGTVTGVLARQRTSNTFPIQGTVAADGAFAGRIIGETGTLPMRGKFTGTSFAGGFHFKDCDYHITMQKAS